MKLSVIKCADNMSIANFHVFMTFSMVSIN